MTAQMRNANAFAAYGGVLGHKLQMESFELVCLRKTARLNDPFHAADCESGFGQFASWELQERASLMKNLVTRIRKQNIWSYGVTVSISDYRSIFPDAAPEHPSLLCAISAMIAMGVFGSVINERIAVWVERGGYDGAVLRAFQTLQQMSPWVGQEKLYSVAFGDKKLVPLQAADLMAREAFKHFDNEGLRPMRKPLIRLGQQMIFHKWRRDGLEHIRDLGYPRDLEGFASIFAKQVRRV
jgi:hypothetical protein